MQGKLWHVFKPMHTALRLQQEKLHWYCLAIHFRQHFVSIYRTRGSKQEYLKTIIHFVSNFKALEVMPAYVFQPLVPLSL